MLYHGVINIYKEKGYTSHDVVAKLRGILKQKKIGHTGTLDPNAEGVLPVCLGKGTKLCEFLTEKKKVYKAVMLLGRTTDTQDTGGTILEEKEVTADRDEIVDAILSFKGKYSQIPPMYSAIKVNGRKLYELAREGKTVDRKPREVVLYEIEINEINMETKEAVFTVACSKGTYIRTLCQDIGEKLGCGGCMKELTRTASGMFKEENSLCLGQIEEMVQNGTVQSAVIPVDEILAGYHAVHVKKEFEKTAYNGNYLTCGQINETAEWENEQKVRLYADDRFIGIYRYCTKKKCFTPVKMFYNGAE